MASNYSELFEQNLIFEFEPLNGVKSVILEMQSKENLGSDSNPDNDFIHLFVAKQYKKVDQNHENGGNEPTAQKRCFNKKCIEEFDEYHEQQSELYELELTKDYHTELKKLQECMQDLDDLSLERFLYS